MKALIYHGPFDMRLEEIDNPQPELTKVLVKVAAVAICGSDVHGYAGKTGRRAPGMVMGHEISGTIESSCSRARRLQTGQKVAIQPIIACNNCEMCRAGNTSICPSRSFIGVDMGRIGGLAEYIAVGQGNVFPVSNDMPDCLACLTEPFAVGVSAVQKADIREGETVVIVGAGVIGLIVLMMVRRMASGQVWIVDKKTRNLELAKRLGGVPINFAEENPVERILEEIEGGVDVAIEAVGCTVSVKTAMYATKNGGRVVWIGNSQKHIELDMQDVVVKGKSIQGTYCYSNDDFGKAIEIINQNRETAGEFVEEQVAPAEAPELFRKLGKEEMELLRGVVLWGSQR